MVDGESDLEHSHAARLVVIDVKVAFAVPDHQEIIALQVTKGTTLIEAIEQSGILQVFPEIDLMAAAKGVFGERRPDHYELCPGDRVEIYRPLIFSPREARKRRASRSS